jgi:hypothetical protein
VTPHDGCRVSPFGHPRIKACLAAPRGLSQLTTSFFGSRRQGIHRRLFVAWKNKDARARYAILKGQCRESSSWRIEGMRNPEVRSARRQSQLGRTREPRPPSGGRGPLGHSLETEERTTMPSPDGQEIRRSSTNHRARTPSNQHINWVARHWHDQVTVQSVD